MTIYITKLTGRNDSFRYRANWTSPDSGYGFYDLYRTLKDLKEYFQSWEQVEFIRTNF